MSTTPDLVPISPQSSPRGPRRRHGARPITVVVVGIAVLAVAGLISYIATKAPDGVPLRDYKTVYASVSDPGNLQLHNEVRIAGVTVGQVLGIESEQGRGLVELKLDPGIDRLPSDTEVFVRGKGLLGARYVQLVPGKSRENLAWGSTIRGGPNALTYGVPDVVDTFDKDTRGALGEMADELGRGLLARGNELNEAVRVSPQGAQDFQAVAHAILDRAGAAQRFVPSALQAATAFDDSREDLTRMLGPAVRGLQPFIEERTAVRDTLSEAPSALRAMQSATGEGRRLLTAARGLSRSLADTLPAAPSGLRAATAMLRDGQAPLGRTTRLLEALDPAVPALLRITGRLSPNLDPLRRAFDDLVHTAKTMAPYGCDIENGADNLRSVIGFPQYPGSSFIGPINAFRATAIIGPEAIGPFAKLPDQVEAGHVYEPYPAPCRRSPGPEHDIATGARKGAP